MLRSVSSKRLARFQYNYGGFTRTTTTVSEQMDVLPFSKIPKLPTVPFLRGGWAYLPFVGKYNLFAFHKASLSKYHEYGSIHLEEFSKEFALLSIFEPKDVEKVFRVEGRYPDRRNVECIKKYRNERKDLYKNGGLLTSSGEDWYEVRTQVQPHMLKPKLIQAYLGAMDQVALQMTDRISQLRDPKNGELSNLLDELYKWALESVALVAVDKRLGCLNENPNEETTKLIVVVTEILALLWKLEFSSVNLWKRFPTPAYIKFKRRMDYFSVTVAKYLAEAKQKLKNKPPDHEITFLEQMISTSNDPRHITAMITDMFFAGIDTTSTTVGLTLYHFARNPETQEKAHQEIMKVLQSKEINMQTLNDMRYLKACVKESMRLTPVSIINARTLPEDTILSGYKVPAGTIVAIQSYIIGLLEKNFPEPKRFLPDRFLREERMHEPFAFTPFGFGPRACIGRRIAEQEIWTLLIRILQRYRMEYHHEEIELATRGVAAPDRPLRIKFIDR